MLFKTSLIVPVRADGKPAKSWNSLNAARKAAETKKTKKAAEVLSKSVKTAIEKIEEKHQERQQFSRIRIGGNEAVSNKAAKKKARRQHREAMAKLNGASVLYKVG